MSGAIEKKRPERRIARAIEHVKTLHVKATMAAESIENFISYIESSLSDPKAQEFAAEYRKARKRTPTLLLDTFAITKGVDTSVIWAWAAEGAYREGQQTIRFVHARHASKIAKANAENALLPGAEGIADRTLFMRAAGVMPTSKGTHVNVVQSNVNAANAAAKSETSLPDFDEQRREIAEVVRADE